MKKLLIEIFNFIFRRRKIIKEKKQFSDVLKKQVAQKMKKRDDQIEYKNRPQKMTKKEFVKLADRFGYEASYCGKLGRFFLHPQLIAEGKNLKPEHLILAEFK